MKGIHGNNTAPAVADTGSDNSAQDYVPKPNEAAATQRLRDRRKLRAKAQRFKVDQVGQKASITSEHQDPTIGFTMLADAFATGDATFANGLLMQIANASRTGATLTADELNFMLATANEIGPRDPVESLLACQMAAIHNATMAAARKLNHVDTLTQQDSASNMLNKLARTFAAQMETLKRYRGTGEQNVRVTHQHVNVTAGQAVVGIQGGEATNETRDQSHVPSGVDERRAALPGPEQAFGLPMPSPRDARPAGVPVSRREGGGA